MLPYDLHQSVDKMMLYSYAVTATM